MSKPPSRISSCFYCTTDNAKFRIVVKYEPWRLVSKTRIWTINIETLNGIPIKEKIDYQLNRKNVINRVNEFLMNPKEIDKYNKMVDDYYRLVHKSG